MTNPKHTPGPWKVNARSGRGITVERKISDGNYDVIAYGLESLNAHHIVRCVNAHYDLLAALETALVVMENDDRHSSTKDLAIASARTAIAKAKGGA